MRYGYRRIRIFLRRQGLELSWSRTHRIWRQAGLLVPRKRSRKRIATGSGTTVADVNRLLKQFADMQKMMRQLMQTGKGGRLPRQMPFSIR